KIGPSLVADVGSVVCAPMLVNARSASTGRTERENLVFMIGSIDPTFRFHKKSYATVAGIVDAGSSCPAVQRIDELDNESVSKTEWTKSRRTTAKGFAFAVAHRYSYPERTAGGEGSGRGRATCHKKIRAPASQTTITRRAARNLNCRRFFSPSLTIRSHTSRFRSSLRDVDCEQNHNRKENMKLRVAILITVSCVVAGFARAQSPSPSAPSTVAATGVPYTEHFVCEILGTKTMREVILK